MKTQTLTINKTPERPDGMEVEVLAAETELEQQLLCYLLTLYVRDARSQGTLDLEVPDRFTVRYNAEGSLTLLGEPNTGDSAYYTPAEPRAVFLIRPLGKRFEIGYAPLDAAARARRPTPDSSGAGADDASSVAGQPPGTASAAD